MISLIPYLGYGDNQEVRFYFRLLHRSHPAEFENISSLSWWHNFKRFYYRYNVKPAPNIPVKVRFNNQVIECVTDKAGLAEAKFSVINDRDDNLYQASVYLNDKEYIVEALIDNLNNEFAIATDIDDTLLISNSWSKRKLIPLTIFGNAATRQAFDGAADFYQSLVSGSTGSATNPIFYVSSSHWNLYDFLENFLQRNNFPKGPILLKETTGWIDMIKNANVHHHKYEKIKQLLLTYQDLEFILIGDSTQADAQIYVDLAIEFPHRIRHIFLRDVTVFVDPLVESALAKAKINRIDNLITIANNTDDLLHKARSLKLIP